MIPKFTIFFIAFLFTLPFSLHPENTFSLSDFLENWVYFKDHNVNVGYHLRPDYVPLSVWEKVEKKLLPLDHPIKANLDKIFSNGQVNKNGQSLFDAGFIYMPLRRKNNLIVALHSKLQGYMIKTYADENPLLNEWKNWLDRIFGAELIAEFLKKNHYLSNFKVPKKWIYLIPYNCKNEVGRPFLLVVENMEVIDFYKNQKNWKKKITKEILKKLYHIIETLGLLDSVYIDNIPFSKDGKISFVDTEHTLKWPVPYSKLSHHLSDQNQLYWKELVSEKIP